MPVLSFGFAKWKTTVMPSTRRSIINAILHAEIMELALHFRRATIADAAQPTSLVKPLSTTALHRSRRCASALRKIFQRRTAKAKEIADPNYHVLLCFKAKN